MLSVALAVLAAIANALASVLQRKAARDRPESESLSWRLVRHLLHRPVWFAGVLSIIAGFLLQATALGNGQISVVQPLLVMELPATLLLASLVFGSRLGVREWGASIMMAAGLAALLYSLSPSPGSTAHATAVRWAFASGVNVLLVAAMVVWARLTGPGARKAALLGVATGCGFGFTAALIKGMTDRFTHGIGALFTSWQLYAMIVAGAGAMFLLQSAMHAGRLLASQPGLTMSDPVVSILWGIFVFGEAVRGGVYTALSVAAAAVVATAVTLLTRSPLLAGRTGRGEQGEAGTESDWLVPRQATFAPSRRPVRSPKLFEQGVPPEHAPDAAMRRPPAGPRPCDDRAWCPKPAIFRWAPPPSPCPRHARSAKGSLGCQAVGRTTSTVSRRARGSSRLMVVSRSSNR